MTTDSVPTLVAYAITAAGVTAAVLGIRGQTDWRPGSNVRVVERRIFDWRHDAPEVW
jgi:hypothetical protein